MTGPLADLDYGIVAVFAACAVLAVFATVLVSAFLPRHSGPQSGRGRLGGVLVWSNALATLLLSATLIYTASLMPLSVAIVVSGLAILGAPFLVEPIPRTLRESRLVLTGLLACVVVSLLVLPTPWTI